MWDHPAVVQAVSLISGAIAMAIVSIVSYYFPKGHDRFDEKRHESEEKTDD